MTTLDTDIRLARAEEKGATAFADGKPLQDNPYVNKAGGRLYYRRWRKGWMEAEMRRRLATRVYDGPPFAVPGEEVIDPATETTVCIVANPLYRHTLVSVADFTDWRVPIPAKGDSLNLTPGFRMNVETGKPQLCIAGEWRP